MPSLIEHQRSSTAFGHQQYLEVRPSAGDLSSQTQAIYTFHIKSRQEKIYLTFVFLLLLEGFLAAVSDQNVVIVLYQRRADGFQYVRDIRSQEDGFLIAMRRKGVCHG